jgi:Protein of unknown function (DUF642)/PEP-CTERM motif
MNSLRSWSAAAAALFIGVSAQAAPIFSDDFGNQPFSLNTAPTGWTVTSGTVDVVTAGFCVSGSCVDLDGSTGDAGVLSRSFNLVAGTLYTLTFDLSGNKRGGLDDVTVGFGSASRFFDDLAANAPYATYTLDFTPGVDGSYAISFSNAGGDNVGALLDNVSIATRNGGTVPEPASAALLLAALLGAVAATRRRARG